MQRNFEREKDGGRKTRSGFGKSGGRPRVYTAEYKVNRSAELLEFLLARCDTSRNNVKALLKNRLVLVNGSVATRHDFLLAKDDEVKISKYPVPEASDRRTDGRGSGKTPRRRFALKILFENDDFIAVDKPAGLLSVESDKETECAFSYVTDYLRQKDAGARPFILHRIDKETSGVLVFAKNIKIHSMLRMKWNEYVKTREYHAVVAGTLKKKEDTIISFLKENANNLMYSTRDPSGQRAVTHYTAVKENAKYSLLRVRIDTGRKNQIRVHMRELGCPVVGDDKYGPVKDPLGRLGLHASKLEFVHPKTGELISITSPLPPSFYTLF